MFWKPFLFVFFFLLVFGPKFGGRIDTLSLGAVLIVGVALVLRSERFLSKYARSKISLWLFFFFAAICYVALVAVVQNCFEAYQFLRFGRCAVNLLGFAALVSLYYRAFGEKAAGVILQHLWLCMLFHAMLMLCMFVSPGVNQFVNVYLRALSDDNALYYERVMGGTRIGGLTSSWDATSGVNALGLLLLVAVDGSVSRTFAPRLVVLFSIPLFVFAMAIAGTTGFVVVPIMLAALLVLGRYKQMFRFTFLALAAACVFVVIVLLAGGVSPEIQDKIDRSALGRTRYMIGETLGFDVPVYKKTKDAGGTIGGIAQMYLVLPENVVDWIVGKGGSGRMEAHYKLHADPGVILNLNNLGLIGFLFLYGLIVFEIFNAFKYRKLIPLANVCILVDLLILIVDSKVQYAYARNGFTLMMVPMICLWEEIARLKAARRDTAAEMPGGGNPSLAVPAMEST